MLRMCFLHHDDNDDDVDIGDHDDDDDQGDDEDHLHEGDNEARVDDHCFCS